MIITRRTLRIGRMDRSDEALPWHGLMLVDYRCGTCRHEQTWALPDDRITPDRDCARCGWRAVRAVAVAEQGRVTA